MRSPSQRVLINRVDIYRATTGRDLDGGVKFPFSLVAQGVPCTAQAQSFGEDNSLERITEVNEWKVIFGAEQNVSPRDKLVLTDSQGVLRTLIVEASRDEAGRGAAFTVRAVEKV